MKSEIKQRIEQIKNGQVPEGYKRTKIGIMPTEWEEKRIGDVLTQRKTLMCVSKDAPLLSFTIEEGVIEPENKKSNKRDFLIKDISTKKFALAEIGDIIYNPANLKFGAIHRNNLRRGVVSPIYGIFYSKQNSEFIGYLLHSQRFIDYSKIYTEGTVEKLKTLKADTFLKLKIALPPLAEQEKIVEILSTQDKLIELYQRKIDELHNLKKIYLSKMFPQKGKNVPEWRFPQFTDAWEQRKLGDIVGIYDGVHQTPNYQNSGVMFLSVENIATLKSSKFISEEDFKRDYKVYPQENDILMTRIGDVGTTNVVTDNGLKAYYVSLALLKYKSTDPYFLSNAIQSDYVQKGLANRTLKTAIPMKINKDEIGSRVVFDGELCYSFIYFRKLYLQQFDLTYEVAYLNFFSDRGYANRNLCNCFKLFCRKGYSPSSSFEFKAFTNTANIGICNSVGGRKSFQNAHVNNSIFRVE